MGRIFSRTATLGVTSSQIAGPQSNRKELIFSPPTAGRYSLAFGEAAVLDSGITIFAGDHTHKLSPEDCAVDVTQSVNAIASAVVTIGFSEIANP